MQKTMGQRFWFHIPIYQNKLYCTKFRISQFLLKMEYEALILLLINPHMYEEGLVYAHHAPTLTT